MCPFWAFVVAPCPTWMAEDLKCPVSWGPFLSKDDSCTLPWFLTALSPHWKRKGHWQCMDVHPLSVAVHPLQKGTTGSVSSFCRWLPLTAPRPSLPTPLVASVCGLRSLLATINAAHSICRWSPTAGQCSLPHLRDGRGYLWELPTATLPLLRAPPLPAGACRAPCPSLWEHAVFMWRVQHGTFLPLSRWGDTRGRHSN